MCRIRDPESSPPRLATRIYNHMFPRGSIYTTIKKLGPKRPSPLWLWGPNTIMVVYVDPLGFPFCMRTCCQPASHNGRYNETQVCFAPQHGTDEFSGTSFRIDFQPDGKRHLQLDLLANMSIAFLAVAFGRDTVDMGRISASTILAMASAFATMSISGLAAAPRRSTSRIHWVPAITALASTTALAFATFGHIPLVWRGGGGAGDQTNP